MNCKKLITSLLLGIGCCCATAQNDLSKTLAFLTEDSIAENITQDAEVLERLRNMPNIEVGKGVTFQPRNKLYKMTMRFRMRYAERIG